MLISANQKKILNILLDGQFHSGTKLAEKIGISRSAICKQLKNLTAFGLEFTAVSGKGYCLESALQLLSESAIEKDLNLTAHSLVSKLEIHDCINSTNSYLVEKSRQTCSSGYVCFAEHQTAGKGRYGREWVSPFGSNIYLSILWQYQNGLASINGLSLVVGVAVIRALKDCGIGDVGLKWPNDIYWKNKKLAGILIEVSGEALGPCSVVIGLGLNFYLPEQKAKSIGQDWVDLNTIMSGNAFKTRNKCAAELLNHLMPAIANFKENTLASYLEEWQEYDCMQGQEVEIYMGQQVFTGVIQGIDNNGLLQLADNQGEIKTFASGEVSFRQS